MAIQRQTQCQGNQKRLDKTEGAVGLLLRKLGRNATDKKEGKVEKRKKQEKQKWHPAEQEVAGWLAATDTTLSDNKIRHTVPLHLYCSATQFCYTVLPHSSEQKFCHTDTNKVLLQIVT